MPMTSPELATPSSSVSSEVSDSSPLLQSFTEEGELLRMSKLKVAVAA